MNENENKASETEAQEEPTAEIDEKDLFPDLTEEEIASLRQRVTEGEAEPPSEAPAEEEEDSSPEEPEEEASEPSNEAEPKKEEDPPVPTAKEPPAKSADEVGMAEALAALGYEDTENAKGWEQALADMRGISVEELRKRFPAAAKNGVTPKEEAKPEESAAPQTPAAAEESTHVSSGDITEAEVEELRQIHDAYPQFRHITKLADLPNFGKIAEARYHGKSVVEAVSSVTGAMPTLKPKSSGKEHLIPSGTKPTASTPGMTRAEMRQAREIFGDEMSDKEIADLYRRATKIN